MTSPIAAPPADAAPPSSDPISTAFAGPDRAVMVAADELASRIAANKLAKDDSPETIKAVFDAAGFDQAGAAADVQRHREIIEVRHIISESRQAHDSVALIDAELARHQARREKVLRELDAEGRRLADARQEPALVATREEGAVRDLRKRLLPAYVQDQLAEIQDRLNVLAPHMQRLEILPPFKPATISEGSLGAATTPARHQQERDRLERVNAEGLRQHEDLVRWLQDRKARAHRLQGREEELRSLYL